MWIVGSLCFMQVVLVPEWLLDPQESFYWKLYLQNILIPLRFQTD